MHTFRLSKNHADKQYKTKLTFTERFIYNSPGNKAAEPLHKMQQQWTTTSSPAKLCSKLRDGYPRVHGVQRPNTSFACTECFGPRHIEDCTMVEEAVKCYCSNNLKNDYESQEINSQDSEHEDKKIDNQYSEYEDEEETYAYDNETPCNKCAPMFDCSSTLLSTKNATTTSESAMNVTTTLSVKNATTTSNPSSLPRMQELPATQAPALLIPPSRRLGKVYWHRHHIEPKLEQ